MSRKLRIAWSVGCGIICLLLIVLWVRSYRYRDVFSGPSRTSGCIWFFSMKGELQYEWDARIKPDDLNWDFNTYSIEEWMEPLSSSIGYWFVHADVVSVVVP